MANRFKGLDLTDRVPEDLWMEACNIVQGFPGDSDGKASAYSAGDPGSIPGLGRSPREGNGKPLQYSCLENPMDGGACRVQSMGSQRVGHDWATSISFSIIQEPVIKTISKKEKCKKSRVVWGGLTNSWEKKSREKQRRKGKIYPSECRAPKNSKEL